MKLSVFIKKLEEIKRKEGDIDVFLDQDWGNELLDDITFETVMNVYTVEKENEDSRWMSWFGKEDSKEIKELHINCF